jgi:hypothetical protein
MGRWGGHARGFYSETWKERPHLPFCSYGGVAGRAHTHTQMTPVSGEGTLAKSCGAGPHEGPETEPLQHGGAAEAVLCPSGSRMPLRGRWWVSSSGSRSPRTGSAPLPWQALFLLCPAAICQPFTQPYRRGWAGLPRTRA